MVRAKESIDWDTRREISDERICFHAISAEHNYRPRITVGIPTFRRGDVIEQAVKAVAEQTFREFVLIISDNAGENPSTLSAVERLSNSLPEVLVLSQPTNLGAIGNMKLLLSLADTEYFLWLADDDHISPNYLQELVNLLDSDLEAVSALGKWRHMTSPIDGEFRSQPHLDSKFRLARILPFVAGRASDYGFYGLHRTSSLRQCRFRGYFPPNRGVLTNWCYAFLFDMLMQGRFRYSSEAIWTCRAYTEKGYSRALGQGMTDRLRTLLRRLNLYFIYIQKSLRWQPFSVPLVAVACVFGLSLDILSFIRRYSLKIFFRQSMM